MGGDEVYPIASLEGYQNRLVGPYRAAPRRSTGDPATRAHGVAGNHDWYDGLTSFNFG